MTFVVVVSVLALGTVLHIDGRALFRMPGALIGHVPLLKNATAQRWPMYSSLAIGVIAAIWLARGQRFGWARWVVVLVGAVMLLPHNDPNQGYPYDRTPAFFTDGMYRAVLNPDENVLLIVGSKGEEMMWQSEADFWFRMPQGYVGPLPPQFREDRAFRGFVAGGFVAEGGYFPQPDELAAWLDRQQVTAVVMVDEAAEGFSPIMREAGWQRVYQGGGVSVWRPNGGP